MNPKVLFFLANEVKKIIKRKSGASFIRRFANYTKSVRNFVYEMLFYDTTVLFNRVSLYECKLFFCAEIMVADFEVAENHCQLNHPIPLSWEICQMELYKEMLIKSLRNLMLKESDWLRIKRQIGTSYFLCDHKRAFLFLHLHSCFSNLFLFSFLQV